MIRSAVPADAPALARVFVRAWQAGYRGVVADEIIDALDIGDWTAAFDRRIRDPAVATAVWVDEDGEVAGFAGFGADSERTDIGDLASLYVEPTMGGRGIGRSLLAHALRELTEQGCVEITLWVFAGNVRARQLYERMGFHSTDEVVVDPRWGSPQVRYRRTHLELPGSP